MHVDANPSYSSRYSLFPKAHLPTLVSGVPARNSQTCTFPSTWLDIWLEPASNTTVSILHNSFAEKGGCVLRLEGKKYIKSFILRSSRWGFMS